jgi:hypothetical protein
MGGILDSFFEQEKKSGIKNTSTLNLIQKRLSLKRLMKTKTTYIKTLSRTSISETNDAQKQIVAFPNRILKLCEK